MAANNWLLQFLADILMLKVEKPSCIETSALGAAYLAGLGAGVYDSLDEIAHHWQATQTFSPVMQTEDVEHFYAGWKSAVERVLT